MPKTYLIVFSFLIAAVTTSSSSCIGAPHGAESSNEDNERDIFVTVHVVLFVHNALLRAWNPGQPELEISTQFAEYFVA